MFTINNTFSITLIFFFILEMFNNILIIILIFKKILKIMINNETQLFLPMVLTLVLSFFLQTLILFYNNYITLLKKKYLYNDFFIYLWE